jgi:hypothetical protein
MFSMVSFPWDICKYSLQCCETQCSKVEYSAEQKLFIYDTSVQPFSCKKFNRNFNTKHPDSIVPHKAMIHNIITKLCSRGIVLDRKKIWKRHVLIEENLDHISTQLEASPKKLLCFLDLQCVRLAKSTAHIGTQMLELWSHKTSCTQSFISRIWYKNFIL